MDNIICSNKLLTEDEDSQFQELVSDIRPSHNLIFHLLRHYGMRVNELLRIRPMDLGDGTLFVPASKGSLPREVPLSKKLYQRLREEADLCMSKDDRIFPLRHHQLYYLWQQHICHHLFPYGQHKKLHALRHTCAVNLFLKTKDIHLVKRLLGHKSLNSTMVYMDFTYSMDSFRKALVG